MPKIFLNGRFLTQKVSGVQRYAYEMLEAFDNLIASGIIDSDRYEIKVVCPSGPLLETKLKNIRIQQIGKLHGHAWEQFELPIHTRGDFLFNPCNTAPIVKRNQIVTIHDASVYGFPQAYSFLFRSWYRILLPLIARRSARVITDSLYSKTELMRFCGLSERDIDVIPLGCEHFSRTSADESILDKQNLRRKPYILAVSSLNLNKNFKGILEATRHLQLQDYDVVVAGGTNHSVFGDKISFSEHIRYLGYVSDAELVALYKHARCFIYPSFYEGFGFPPLEAMYCGCPVVASRTTSLPEVCGDAALYCNPLDPRDIAAKIHAIMTDNQKRELLKLNAQKQVLRFSWNKCALSTWNLIEQVAD